MIIQRKDFIPYIENRDLDVFNWYREMLSIPLEADGVYITYDSKTNIVTFKNSGLTVELNNERSTPLLLSDSIGLDVRDMGIVTEKGYYTLTDIILNYLLIYRPFGNTALMFTLDLDIGIIENYIARRLGDSISVEDYSTTFIECCGMLEQLSDLVTVSSTNKSIRPAPGISELKRKLYKEARDRLGDSFVNDIKAIVEIDKKLEAHDIDYLKDDPTFGVIVTPKITGNARKNLYGTVGAEIGMDGRVTPVIENSLLEGYPADNKLMASMINSSRKGSIFRGFMTQFTGADANTTIRVLNGITIKTEDCGTTDTYGVLISKDNFNEYIDFYIMEDGKPLLLTEENIKPYIGKVVPLRSYLFCKDRYCGICSGRQGQDNNKIAIILSTENNAVFTNGSMKAMHDKTLKLVDYDLHTAIF